MFLEFVRWLEISNSQITDEGSASQAVEYALRKISDLGRERLFLVSGTMGRQKMSLKEIANLQGVTISAVGDAVRRYKRRAAFYLRRWGPPQEVRQEVQRSSPDPDRIRNLEFPKGATAHCIGIIRKIPMKTGCATISELVENWSERELLQIKGFGTAVVTCLKEILALRGLELKKE